MLFSLESVQNFLDGVFLSAGQCKWQGRLRFLQKILVDVTRFSAKDQIAAADIHPQAKGEQFDFFQLLLGLHRFDKGFGRMQPFQIFDNGRDSHIVRQFRRWRIGNRKIGQCKNFGIQVSEKILLDFGRVFRFGDGIDGFDSAGKFFALFHSLHFGMDQLEAAVIAELADDAPTASYGNRLGPMPRPAKKNEVHLSCSVVQNG